MKNKIIESFVVGIMGLAIIFLISYFTNIVFTAAVSMIVILFYAIYLKRLMKQNKVITAEKIAGQQPVQFQAQNIQQVQKVPQTQSLRRPNMVVQPLQVPVGKLKEIKSEHKPQDSQQRIQQRTYVKTDEDVLREIAERQKRMKQGK